MTRQQALEAYRQVWRRAKQLRDEAALTEREHKLADDVQRSAQQFATELKAKQHTPTKMRDFERTARYLEGMLDRIDKAVKGRAA